MSDMVEKVAKAIWDSTEVPDWADAPETVRAMCRGAARAAIEAMAQSQPKAWMRRWAFDGVEGEKGNRPPGWAFHAVSQVKCLPTDVPLFSVDAALKGEAE